MKRRMPICLTLCALMALTACDGQESSKTAKNQTIQISSVKWDEVAAASSAAHVTNNNLIMMR